MNISAEELAQKYPISTKEAKELLFNLEVNFESITFGLAGTAGVHPRILVDIFIAGGVRAVQQSGHYPLSDKTHGKINR